MYSNMRKLPSLLIGCERFLGSHYKNITPTDIGSDQGLKSFYCEILPIYWNKPISPETFMSIIVYLQFIVHQQSTDEVDESP